MASIAASRPSLTSNDAAVLQALFDAESSPSSGITVDSSLPPWPKAVNISQEDLLSLKNREIEIIRELQPSMNPTCEVVQSAVDRLSALLVQYPSYPSAYTNRAQAFRMLVDLQFDNTEMSTDDTSNDALFTPQAADMSSQILADLGQAITYATPASPADPVSSAQARLLADAHTHRGYLLLKAARLKKNAVEKNEEAFGPDRLRELGADQLEEMASRDFFLGGRYGNKVAQQLAVQTNPYAKMCGAIVQEAMRKEIEG
ncbi:hypothetical protein N7466_008416 [Penicillium verhagenii]|uniref:uncharacterized protein n=1 Tax=Penicillium verhagenii TaxID=1562060 RepID=UPI0025457CE8|nr:uncharacterized protein N7466_008416 [Penicillium verhagenii]KAJ5924229.1 hypothetical protein N7466_008416 [Penicillium verhagenii]